jgi:hypothetical protein
MDKLRIADCGLKNAPKPHKANQMMAELIAIVTE